MNRMSAIGLSLLLGLGALAAAAPAAAGSPVAKRFFATLPDATTACGADTVVWVNKTTGVYHLKESRWFGKTKDGAYGCRIEMDQAGYHGAKLEK
jgi:hypothetical protein